MRKGSIAVECYQIDIDSLFGYTTVIQGDEGCTIYIFLLFFQISRFRILIPTTFQRMYSDHVSKYNLSVTYHCHYALRIYYKT